MDHQKSNFSLISDALSVGGCWGQPMLFFWKMVMVPKNSLFQHSRTTFKPNLTCISLFVSAISIWDTLYNCLEKPEKSFSNWVTCFPSSWEQEDCVEKWLCKFEAVGREFVTFSRHCSGSRELGKQVTNTSKRYQQLSKLFKRQINNIYF